MDAQEGKPITCRRQIRQSIKRNDPADDAVTKLQDPDRMERRPTPIGGAAGVEQQHAVLLTADGLVTVAEDQAIETLPLEFPQKLRLQMVGRSPAMDQADAESTDLNDLARGDVRDDRVHVAAYHMESSPGKSHQDVRIDHVTGMQNDFGVGKVPLCQRLQKGNPLFNILEVCIGKHSDFQSAIPLRYGLPPDSGWSLRLPSITEHIMKASFYPWENKPVNRLSKNPCIMTSPHSVQDSPQAVSLRQNVAENGQLDGHLPLLDRDHRQGLTVIGSLT